MGEGRREKGDGRWGREGEEMGMKRGKGFAGDVGECGCLKAVAVSKAAEAPSTIAFKDAELQRSIKIQPIEIASPAQKSGKVACANTQIQNANRQTNHWLPIIIQIKRHRQFV